MSLRILITNDDGVDAPGLQVLLGIARQLSDDVWVVAPDGNQSGAGHRFSFGRELSLDKRSERTFAVKGGSPADCVVAGMTFVLGDKPADLVLSGVNNGQNLGDIVHCSGTVAGAREGTMQGAVGIALSQAVDYAAGLDVEWTNAQTYGAELVRSLMGLEHGKDVYYNVNFPSCPAADVTGVRVVPHQRFSRSPMRYYPSDNAGKFFVAIPETPRPLDEGSDFHLLTHGDSITVTPLSLLQTDADVAGRLDGQLPFTRRR
ncbi:5'-nucleotidase SurE [Youhaiella tibetensis]|uniref:5'-nucleotidase SurE n=1 Tax=Paradevosia tibetensis TaxID=1447062 RepID=A0A5B9DP05_9HYPH|nr:5'/3'-nucleotidase SurE [Youhaiella tibetensis]QEE20742.1 5'/3'-nucleotidase SurE [Youhaiella tibetensis]GGF21436.1 5'-nucleotidase SurE [Youhaiella tibetensis]